MAISDKGRSAGIGSTLQSGGIEGTAGTKGSHIMRMPITIDDRPLEALKRRAVETGSTVSRLIEDAVRRMLHGSAGVESPEFELVIYGHGGRFTSHDADRTWTLLEQEDMERHGGVR